MAIRAVALLSGGLDSILSIRILQLQGVDVEAINFQTIFSCCQNTAALAAHQLGVPLTVIGQEDEYVELVRSPQHGYGKGANPCVDCRIYMFQRAKTYMEQVGGSIVVSGEVVGQRPMSQKRRDLLLIARKSGLNDRLLRPLSAKLLPRTLPEQLGQINRDRLYAFYGRGRKGLISLAAEFGIHHVPAPSTGCALTEKSFAGKVHDLIQLDPKSQRWDFELLKVGRHLRLDHKTKVVVGRRAQENEILETMYFRIDSRASAKLAPQNFRGPTLLLIGPANDDTLSLANGLMSRYAKPADRCKAVVRQDVRRSTQYVPLGADARALTLTTL